MALYEALQQDRPDITTLATPLGTLLHDIGRPQDAIAALRASAATNPTHETTRRTLGNLLLVGALGELLNGRALVGVTAERNKQAVLVELNAAYQLNPLSFAAADSLHLLYTISGPSTEASELAVEWARKRDAALLLLGVGLECAKVTPLLSFAYAPYLNSKMVPWLPALLHLDDNTF